MRANVLSFAPLVSVLGFVFERNAATLLLILTLNMEMWFVSRFILTRLCDLYVRTSYAASENIGHDNLGLYLLLATCSLNKRNVGVDT